ncbi:sigma-70 family RNA polymerase sigma factor [Thermophagus sp. OGC60D27]|uniref:sigma-70 family RNA polymerase sigma factor n=1 Tax=Thermophagus sp. OGC60D27 TaxID=3458415 RepID=UPI00403824A0
MSVEKRVDLTHLVESYAGDLYSWALHKVSDKELAKDLVQDTFLVAVEKLDGFKGDSSPKTWLFSILNNKIVDVYRKKVKQPVNMDPEVFSALFNADGGWQDNKHPNEWEVQEPQLLDDSEFQQVLKKCLDALPEKWNICVKLKYLSGKNGQEICQELGIAPTNFWQIVHRAKLQLRDCVENNWFKN